MDDRSSCRCSCTRDWYSARHASTSLPLVQHFSRSPSRSLLRSWKRAMSSPPTTNAGQKQLKPCPKTDLEATVDRTQFTNSSKKRRTSRRNCPQVIATNFVQCSHHAGASEKVFFINCREPQMIRGKVFFPLFHKGQ